MKNLNHLAIIGLATLFAAAQPTSISPCEGLNENMAYNDGSLMGGPMVALEFTPSSDLEVAAIEVMTGEVMAANALGIWSDAGGIPDQPIAWTEPFVISNAVDWQGADLNVPVGLLAGVTYWITWDPAGNEQASLTSDPGAEMGLYYGSDVGTVSGGASWFGPFTGSWMFRVLCGSQGCQGPMPSLQ